MIAGNIRECVNVNLVYTYFMFDLHTFNVNIFWRFFVRKKYNDRINFILLIKTQNVCFTKIVFMSFNR